jgi:hypothetical protein
VNIPFHSIRIFTTVASIGYFDAKKRCPVAGAAIRFQHIATKKFIGYGKDTIFVFTGKEKEDPLHVCFFR